MQEIDRERRRVVEHAVAELVDRLGGEVGGGLSAADVGEVRGRLSVAHTVD